MASEVFRPHSLKQQEGILSDDPLTLMLTGIQWGKTTTGGLWMKRQVCTHTDPLDNFLVLSPTYKIMSQSTLPPFLRLLDGMGTYNKQESAFTLGNGSMIYMRTGTEPDSIVGITNVRAIWGDEAGKYSLYFWENIQARASLKEAPIMLTTTPYTTNWLFRDFIRHIKQGKKIPGLRLIQASSYENPNFSRAEYDRKKQTMDPRRFAALYEGQFEKMHGLVYDCFNEEVHVVEPFALPAGTRFYGGIDWGFTDPFVLNIRAITPTGHHFLVSEFYKTGMTPNDIIQVAKTKQAAFGVQLFYADPSRPDYIQALCDAGVSCIAAANDRRIGIDRHYELIRENRYHVFKDAATHTIDEYSTYHYPSPDELLPDQNSKEALPVQQEDHTMDAERYLTISTYRSQVKKPPTAPEDKPKVQLSNEQRIAQLKKGRARYHGSESW